MVEYSYFFQVEPDPSHHLAAECLRDITPVTFLLEGGDRLKSPLIKLIRLFSLTFQLCLCQKKTIVWGVFS